MDLDQKFEELSLAEKILYTHFLNEYLEDLNSIRDLESNYINDVLIDKYINLSNNQPNNQIVANAFLEAIQLVFPAHFNSIEQLFIFI